MTQAKPKQEAPKRQPLIEFKLAFFLIYIGTLLFFLIRGYGWMTVFWTHLFFVLIYSIYHFGREFLEILVAPLMAVSIPIHHWFSKRYLKRLKQNVPARTVIVLGHSDWRKLEAWIKPNYSFFELKALVNLLKKKGQDFSFYPKASVTDVEIIMKNDEIKEVYFMGHGNSHLFQLGTDDLLYYCEFKGGQYKKDFVHQIHCGTEHGKSLIDYVVPEQNRSGCFLIRKSITGLEIEKELKQRIGELG